MSKNNRIQHPPVNFSIRSAGIDDRKAIRRLIRITRLYPFHIDWRRFCVVIDESGRVIGIGQLKHHRGGAIELASIGVERKWRGNGIGRAIIEHLLCRSDTELWLRCKSSMIEFYRKFGFTEVSWKRRAPRHFRAMRAISSVLRLIARRHDYIALLCKT